MPIQPARLFVDIGELLTLQGVEAKEARHVKEEDLSIINDAVMVCVDGRLEWVGSRSEFRPSQLSPWGGEAAFETVSFGGRTVIPAFVECHTHSVFAGTRAHEFEWRMQGQTYQEISAKGGGILSTVRETRRASAEQLAGLVQSRVDRFLHQGVTAMEVKSGYGLDLETEMKCLRVARGLKGPKIVTTYLGAHSRSPDFADLPSYVNELVSVILPRIAEAQLADRVDIYIEKGFYDLELARRYLDRARDLGFPITAHVEQLSPMGGVEMCLNYAPQSVDHVVYIQDEAIKRLSRTATTAVLLPASDFYLEMNYPPARKLIDSGVRVALSTDYNPGTSPTWDLSFIGVLARVQMKMTRAEVLAAYTMGAAWGLGLERERGALTLGKQCDFTVLDGSWGELFYSVGYHPVTAVYRRGECVVESGRS